MDKMAVGDAWADDRDHAYWQQDTYRLTPAGETPPRREQVDTRNTHAQRASDEVDHPYAFDRHVNSVIGDPSPGDALRPRDDGGDTWTDASFLTAARPGAWRLFRYCWNPDPGAHALCSRATDEHGRMQPPRPSGRVGDWSDVADDEYPWNAGGYGLNAYEPRAVHVTVTR